MSDEDADTRMVKDFLEGDASKEDGVNVQKIDEGGEMFCPPEVEEMDSRKIKYCNLNVMTNMSKRDIADVLNVDPSTLSNWDKETKVDRLKKNIKKQYQADQLELLRKENAYMRKQAFKEMMDRWGVPDPQNDLPSDATMEERQMYMERFFQNMSAKDFVKLWKMISKQIRLDEPEGVTEKHGGGVDPQKVRERRSKVERKRKKYRNKRKKISGGDDNEKTDNDDEEVEDVEVEDGDGEEIEAELVNEDGDEEIVEEEIEEETLSVEEYQIR